MKKLLSVSLLIFTLSACSSNPAPSKELTDLKNELTEKNATIESLQKAKNEADSKLTEADKKYAQVKAEYDSYKEKMKVYESLSEAEASIKLAKAEEEKKAAEAAKKAEAEKIAAEKAAKEEADRKAKEEEERKGYDTGVTYENLARTPKDFRGKKVKFTGTVVQLMEGSTYNQLRFAVDDDYKQMLYLEYNPKSLSVRVLEDDTITIYGIAMETITYDSTMGGKITIPAVAVDKIEIQ